MVVLGEMAEADEGGAATPLALAKLIDPQSLLHIALRNGDKKHVRDWMESFLIAVRAISRP